jgi:acyl-CoA synthetase (AMP-forming)/AMP-acid ligase II/acyl carrier protein
MGKESPEGLTQVTTLVDLLRQRADHQGDRVAYDFLADGESITATVTYGQLDTLARAIATLLQGLNCQGQPVLLLYPPGLDYIAAFFGCLYAGAIAVPAYPPRPNRSLQRLQVMIEDAGATVALTHSGVLSGIEKRLQDHSSLQRLQWLATDPVDVGLAAPWHPPTVTGDSLALLQYTSGSTGDPKGVMISHGNLLHNSARINALFGDSHTSRGVSWLPPYHDMGLVGGILQPLYVGVPVALMPPVAFLQKPLRWLQAISQYGATTSGGPNFAYDLCVQKTTPEQRQALDLSHWRLAFSGAEPVRPETLDRFGTAFAVAGFQRRAFYPCYGMAETTLIVTGGGDDALPIVYRVQEQGLQDNRAIAVEEPDGAASDGAASDADIAEIPAEPIRLVVGCGQAPADQGLQIVHPQTTQPCSESEVGEIWVAASGSLAQGYWQRPAQTEATFRAYTAAGEGPYLRTGDLGFLRSGELFVTGRLKELIIIRGRNYYPKDIETTVETAHVALRPGAGAAFTIPVAGEERLVVVQEVDRQYLRSLDTAGVVAAVRRAVSEVHDLQLYGLQLLKTGGLPKTSSGKIQRYLCRSGYLDHRLAAVHTWQRGDEVTATAPWDSRESGPVAPVPPLPPQATPDQIQAWLLTWLGQTLQVPVSSLDPARPFAEYGLDSVAAVELTALLQTHLNLNLSPTLAYEYPTIEAIAAYLGQQLGHRPQTPAIAADTAPPEDEGELAALVNELEQLSEAELEALLGQQGR